MYKVQRERKRWSDKEGNRCTNDMQIGKESTRCTEEKQGEKEKKKERMGGYDY